MKKRKMPLHITVMGGILSLVGSLWPALTSYFAYRVWFSTPRYRESKRETVWRNSAQTELLNISGKQITVYRWGTGQPHYVLLIHGWSGRGTQMAAFADPINQRELDVISFDAPGHGASDGHKTNIFEIANVVNELVKKYSAPRAIIAHSFGCMVAALALRTYQLRVDKLVTISCPTDTRYLMAGFAIHFNLNEKVMSRFHHKLYKQFGEDIYEKTSAEQNLKQVAIKLLVVHDKDDQIVSWRQSDKLAKAVPGAKTYYTNKMGHQHLLRDNNLIRQVVEFVGSETTN